jgi:hypothetical protein
MPCAPARGHSRARRDVPPRQERLDNAIILPMKQCSHALHQGRIHSSIILEAQASSQSWTMRRPPRSRQQEVPSRIAWRSPQEPPRAGAADDSRGLRVYPPQACHRGRCPVSIAYDQAHLTACPAPHGGDSEPARHRGYARVSLWLGHTDIQTTEAYLCADSTEKLDAMHAVVSPRLKRGQLRAPDKLIASLHST